VQALPLLKSYVTVTPMQRDLIAVGLTVFVGLGLAPWPGLADPGAAAPRTETVANADEYFPDSMGSRWRYRGEVVETPLQKISNGFVNVSTVKGAETIKGVSVKVFHDTNPGNHGPSDSYYRRDAAGIVYYGSEPGTALEKQLVPYQIVRFPLEFPSSFQQFDRKGLDFGSDLDGDDANEQADVQASVTVVGKESVAVPTGTYPDAIRIEAKMTMQIHLSSDKRVAVGTDTMTAWFAKGVGLVKYVERQEIPPFRSDRGLVTEIMEELEEVEVKRETASLQRCEPPAKRVLAHDAGHHELSQVAFATGLGPDPRQAMAAKGLAAHQRAGDRSVDVEVAHVKGLTGCPDVRRTP